MNLLTFFSQIILGYLVCYSCHPFPDDSLPEEDDNNGLFDADGTDDTNPSPGAVVKEYQSKEFTAFDLLLLQGLFKQNPKTNIVISPSSIKSLLALMIKVYSKEKFDAISKVSDDKERSISLVWKLQTLLQNNGTEMTIESRNKIYQASNVNLMPTVGSATEVETLDFSSPSAVDIINKWVYESTRGLIPSIIERNQISELTKLVLLNCVYLKAKWDLTFNPSLTQDGCFYRTPGKCSQVKFMYNDRHLQYADLPKYSSIMFELPFVDQRYAITFLLPNENSNVYVVLKSLKYADLFALFDSMSTEKVKLKLPRTTIEFMDSNLLQTLTKSTIKSFFGRNVKLDHMLKSDTLKDVDTLFHRARIVLNEEGAEAAAVSGGIEFRSGWTMEPLSVTVDRPFLFFLRDTNSGLILFEGVVQSPDGKY